MRTFWIALGLMLALVACGGEKADDPAGCGPADVDKTTPEAGTPSTPGTSTAMKTVELDVSGMT
jgi:hypothetical protein